MSHAANKSDRLGFTYIWKIENFSYCSEKKNKPLASPSFVLDNLLKTKWHLLLYPRGVDDENYIAYYLQREDSDSGPAEVTIDFELTFISSDGSPLQIAELNKHTFEKSHGYGIPSFVKRDEVFRNEESSFLVKDTLTARCRIWRSDTAMQDDDECVARTRIGVEKGSFRWDIQDFSKLQANRPKTIIVERIFKENPELTVALFLTGGYAQDRTVQIEISQVNVTQTSFSTCKVAILDVRGKALDFSEDEYWFDAKEGKQVWNFPPFMTKNKLMSKKNLYLPDDVLSLRFQCALSIGVESNEIESTTQETSQNIIPRRVANPLYRSRNSAGNKRNLPPVRNFSISDTFVHDLHCMYEEGLLCDFKLRAGAETFPVHKCVLCARSPVFRAMFTNEMMERDSDFLDIPDLDADTMQRLLMFVYTDSVEDMKWESASKLYFAADKYAIQSLKQKCSYILRATLCAENFCHLLLLSDLHQDQDLKQAVQEFILFHESEVFHSDEWKGLENDDLELAFETMRDVYMKKLQI